MLNGGNDGLIAMADIAEVCRALLDVGLFSLGATDTAQQAGRTVLKGRQLGLLPGFPVVELDRGQLIIGYVGVGVRVLPGPAAALTTVRRRAIPRLPRQRQPPAPVCLRP